MVMASRAQRCWATNLIRALLRQDIAKISEMCDEILMTSFEANVLSHFFANEKSKPSKKEEAPKTSGKK